MTKPKIGHSIRLRSGKKWRSGTIFKFQNNRVCIHAWDQKHDGFIWSEKDQIKSSESDYQWEIK